MDIEALLSSNMIILTGMILTNTPFFSVHRDALQVFLYYDELEVTL